MAAISLCKTEGCGKPALARDMCGAHYQRWRKSATAQDVRKHAKPGEPLSWIENIATYEGDECVIWPFGKYPSGYGMLNLPDGAIMASRYLCIRIHGEPIEESDHAAHSCGRGADGCMTPRHLSWKTRADNESDKIGHGTSNRGARNGHSKITEETVLAIRASSLGPTAAARMFGVSATTVCDIRSRRSWGWLA